MHWTLFATTFVTVFIAEMGDKTQLATLNFAGTSDARWTIFAGSALALVATSAIAVLAGAAIGRVIPPHWMQRGAGVLFIVLGVLYLVRSAPPG